MTEPSSPPRVHLLDLAAVSILALVIRIPVYFAGIHQTFDDGVFGASTAAWRAGGTPFRTIYSSQMPLFLPLVRVGDWLGGETINSPRVIGVASGVALAAIAYWTALQLTDRTGALIAGALTATSGCLLWISGSLAADGPALAFALAAVGIALRYRTRPTWRHALGMGLCVGASLCVKAIEPHVAVPVAMVLLAPVLHGLAHRRWDLSALSKGVMAVAVAGAVYVASAAPFGFAEVWDQAILYNTDASLGPQPVTNARKIIATVWDRDHVVIAMMVLALVAVLQRRFGRTPWLRRVDVGPTPGSGAVDFAASSRHADPAQRPAQVGAASGDPAPSDSMSRPSWLNRWTDGPTLIWAWNLATLAWLLFVVSPMWRPHVSAVLLPPILLLCRYRPTVRRGAVAWAGAAVVLAGLQVQELIPPPAATPFQREAIQLVRDLPSGARAMSDDPGLVWRAGRLTPDDLVDASMLRRLQRRYTQASLLRDARNPHVCAFITTSTERFAYFTELPDQLAELGYRRADRTGTNAEAVYVRGACTPAEAASGN